MHVEGIVFVSVWQFSDIDPVNIECKHSENAAIDHDGQTVSVEVDLQWLISSGRMLLDVVITACLGSVTDLT